MQKVPGKILQAGDLHRWIQHSNARLQATAAEHRIKKEVDMNGILTKHGKRDARAAWQEEKICDRIVEDPRESRGFSLDQCVKIVCTAYSLL